MHGASVAEARTTSKGVTFGGSRFKRENRKGRKGQNSHECTKKGSVQPSHSFATFAGALRSLRFLLLGVAPSQE